MRKIVILKIARSIGAVIAGFLTIAVLSIATDAVLTGIGVFPPKPEAYTSWMLLIAVVYRSIFAVLGGFVIGKLAPSKPMKHVAVLAVIGTLIGIGGVITGWNLPGYPHWYAITLAVLTFPTIWYGGKLAVGKKEAS